LRNDRLISRFETSSITPDLLPFKKGAFRLAVETQSPIVPIVFANYSYLYNSKERKFKSGTIKVRVLPPIETKGMGPEDVDALIRRTVEVMDKTYKEISLPLSRL
jgi:lysophosphatidate acyltransferase